MKFPKTLFALLLVAFCLGADNRSSHRQADKAALAPLQPFIGQWRGVGQVRRGSNDGAWIERSDWAWTFSQNDAAVTFDSPQAKHLRSGILRPAKPNGRYELEAQITGGEKVVYTGSADDSERLILTAADAPAGVPARISFRLVAGGKRLVALYERKSAVGDTYRRLAEVGYTRKGSGFGKAATQVECVVTGGLGTIPVAYEGKTYYVCCGGCRDLFNDDPAAALAEYRQRQEEKREAGKKENDQKD